MTLTPESLAKLASPLDPKRVKHREGSGGRSLSYLEGHDVIRAANDVFGIGQWGYHVDDLTLLGEEAVTTTRNGQTKTGYRVAYRATVAVHVLGVNGCSDVGYGDAQEYTGSKLTPHELASKEAVTDGLKRALKNFGDQFGLCLYDKAAPEHDGYNAKASAGDVAASASGRAAASSPAGSAAAPQFVPPADPNKHPKAGADGEWVWPFGKNKGVKLADTSMEDVMWYAEKGRFEDVKARCVAFLAVPGGGFVADDDIPFLTTIDGLGN